MTTGYLFLLENVRILQRQFLFLSAEATIYILITSRIHTIVKMQMFVTSEKVNPDTENISGLS
jgi:hypothetical protein